MGLFAPVVQNPVSERIPKPRIYAQLDVAHVSYNPRIIRREFSEMKTHTAVVKLLERFELGKNTYQNSGLTIEVFSRAEGKWGPKLGTIRIGQGTFDWWAKNAKTETKTGPQKPTISFSWSEFAAVMNEKAEAKNK